MKVHFNPIQNTIQTPRFKSNITFDIGGSQREGSCKIHYTSTPTDELFYDEHTTVNNLGNARFKDPNDFINLIIAKIKRIQKESKNIVKEKGYDNSENSLKNIAIFLPSYTDRETAFYLPNLRNNKDKPLKDISFENFKQRLQENGILVAEDMHFKLLQDAMGTGLAMTKKLYEADMLRPGKLYTACITGGGCGIANIEMIDDENVIIKSSGSSYLSQSLNLQKVSRAGASAPALTENFCKAMGFNEEVIDEIKSCNKAEFVLQPEVTFAKDVKTKKLRDVLLETGKYEISRDENEIFAIKIKQEFMDKFNTARRNAIDKYCLALARLAIIKKTEGSNGMIVTGTLAGAIDYNSRASYGIGIGEWVMQHLTQSFNSYELDKMQKVYNFNVFCNEHFSIDNNTQCGELVHYAKFIAPDRSNWLKLNIKHIEHNAKKFATKIK